MSTISREQADPAASAARRRRWPCPRRPGSTRRPTGGETPGGIGFSCHRAPVRRAVTDELWRALGSSRTGGQTVSSPAPGEAISHPVTITIDSAHPGPLLPNSNAGISGNLFNPDNISVVTLFLNMGMHSLRVGGGSVEQHIPAGTGTDGYDGIDKLFAFAAMTGVKVVYTFRLLNPAANPISDLQGVNAKAAGYIWAHYRDNVSSFAIGNEPDWHTYHSWEGRQNDPTIFENVANTAGSAYPSYLARWRS